MEVQLDAERDRAAHLESLNEKAEQEVIGLEAEVEHLSSKIEEFKQQLEEAEEARGQGDDVLQMQLEGKTQEILHLKATVEEAKAHNSKLLQENLAMVAKADNAIREVRPLGPGRTRKAL